jgi:hypothetical protein
MTDATSVIETFGKIAGVGGLALGVAFFVFRDVIAKNIFPSLTKTQAYRLLRLIVVFAFVVAVVGMVLWTNPTLVIGSGNTTVDARSAKDSNIRIAPSKP